MKRLSLTEEGRAMKYVLSSESAVTMVRDDFPLLDVERGGWERGI